MLTEEQVRHIAKLARLHLSDEEVTKFAGQLTNILDYVDILGETNTDDVAETSQVTGLENVVEEDEIKPSQSSPEELLATTELEVDTNQILVKKAI